MSKPYLWSPVKADGIGRSKRDAYVHIWKAEWSALLNAGVDVLAVHKQDQGVSLRTMEVVVSRDEESLMGVTQYLFFHAKSLPTREMLRAEREQRLLNEGIAAIVDERVGRVRYFDQGSREQQMRSITSSLRSSNSQQFFGGQHMAIDLALTLVEPSTFEYLEACAMQHGRVRHVTQQQVDTALKFESVGRPAFEGARVIELRPRSAFA